jgi:SAM-dependent methyltransferase
MFGKVKPEHLSTYLRKIEKIFPEFAREKNLNADEIKKYYQSSFWGYAIFHSWAGAIHMALSPSGRFSKNDYFRQAEEIAEQIEARGISKNLHILEIGCGRAFNLNYLSKKFASCTFTGVDLSEMNIDRAVTENGASSRVSLIVDDFQELSKVNCASVDVAFAVEALCHASDMREALKTINRVLKDGGELIIFDGFRRSFDKNPAEIQKAVKYTEKAMAVNEFLEVDDFIAIAEEVGLRCIVFQDRSSDIKPNLIRLSDLAKMYFKIGVFSQAALRILPEMLVANAIAGLLMAVTVEVGAHRYFKIVLVKQSGDRSKRM